MDILTTKQILSKLKKDGIPITKRTFEYYQSLGFLPKPYKKVGEKGRGVYGYYDPGIVTLIWIIWKLKKKGFSLKKIREYQKISIFEKYEKYLKKWGFSGKWDSGSIIIGAYPTITDEWLAGFREFLREEGYTEKRITKNISNLINSENVIRRRNKERSEASVIETLNWYDTEEKIEYEVVKRICDELSVALVGIDIAYKEILQSDKPVFPGIKTITSREEYAKFLIETLSDETPHSKVTIKVARQIVKMRKQLDKARARIDELEKILVDSKMYKRE